MSFEVNNLNAYKSSFGAAHDPYMDGSGGFTDGQNRVMNTLNKGVYAGFDVGHIALAAVGLVVFMKLRK
jgi:hypothetical protein